MSEKMSFTTEAVINAALEWWQGHRPTNWSRAEHLRHPAVNTGSSAEAALAEAVALWWVGTHGD